MPAHHPPRPARRAAATRGRRITGVCAVALPTALLALQLGLGPAAQAHEGVGAGPRAASSVAAPDKATISEGQVEEVAPGGVITYPSVTSCLTVTVRLREGGLVGAHASLFQVPGELRSDQILAALKGRVGDRAVASVEVRGAVGAWHPSYFAKAIESYGEGEQVPVPTVPDPDGIARAVSEGLGTAPGLVSVEDVPDGDQVVS
ncbi:hypothetical protein [Streptomyces formicae]|uniref:Uncharacterized protein n=1 Tax=Streptomyces formicae TaxID=1616117 RepID=A0A291QKD7_9ACTN|nr:hypothetical protein [Streptomyces formicae]ATL31923.1 hypothetical protein KY5_6905 [Streptomyces formicae]